MVTEIRDGFESQLADAERLLLGALYIKRISEGVSGHNRARK